MFEWIIIGGGVHGCTIATYLIKSGKADSRNLLIIDPNEEPMAVWKRNTSRISMNYLRSPFVHHIDTNPFSLHQFGKRVGTKEDFYGHYKRPSLSLFNEHTATILKDITIQNMWYQAIVTGVHKKMNRWAVHTSKGTTLLDRNIVISISLNQHLSFPNWADQGNQLKNIHHIFSEEFPELRTLQPPFVVVGGGITAAHTVIKLASLFPGQVTLVKRHPFRVQSFDSDPGWLGPKFMSEFSSSPDYEKRRKWINEARHRGSIMKELNQKIQRLQEEKKVHVVTDEVQSANQLSNKVKLKMREGKSLQARTVILATGFESRAMSQSWLKELIEEERLQCARCGYPIVNESLEWCRHLYVLGPLAELELGPVSRNISGARKAAERIVFNS
ncbi:hypothetical protein Q73_04280 [Bacillus coahuilensis m2-6]|uniref:FAD/NAD(P)-binding protein n=1 Tax=Bacillus coahuilensis TaxID=408580 RepID=UPI000750231D|nr:FAD/NAD(P)-binding protein [Bacillus coahuilensis]KUP08877.1 hypothetical protein Q73_04280 [Bacillus coahuilensis m2-6]